MKFKDFECQSVRTFLGAKNYEESKRFYEELGYEIIEIDARMCHVRIDDRLGFYLQDYYVKKWVNNCMVFLEVEQLDDLYAYVQNLDLTSRYKYVRMTEIKEFDWGREFFMHDPSGNLWHFGCFKDKV